MKKRKPAAPGQVAGKPEEIAKPGAAPAAAPGQVAGKPEEIAKPGAAPAAAPGQVAGEPEEKAEPPAAPGQTAGAACRFVWRGAWRENPVFVYGLALAPVLGAAFSLKNGVLLSAAMLVSVIFESAVSLPVRRLLPRAARPAVMFVSAAVASVPVCLLGAALAPSVAASCGVYLPLVPVCALPMIEKYAAGPEYGKGGKSGVLLPALRDGAGFAAAALLVSAVREVLGLGTLYDRPLFGTAGFKVPLALLPCGSFILLACFLALFSALGSRAKGGDAK